MVVKEAEAEEPQLSRQYLSCGGECNRQGWQV